MISFNKKSFLLQFLLYFSLTLIMLGVVQAVIGTVRLYNPSEQEYEKLSPKKVSSIPTEIVPTPKPEKIIIQESPKETIYYVAEKQNIKDAPSEDTKPTISPKKIQTTKTQKESSPSITSPLQKEEIISPIRIVISPEKETAPKGYKETIQSVVTGKYFRDALWKFPIIIDTKRIEPRGQMYNESISLGSGMKSLPEVSKVLVHEIGHMIDIYALKKTLRKSDPSQEFYQISWKDTTTIRAGVPQKAFVSGYAASNQYEDFSESFVMYVFHNKEFLKRTQENDFLKQKYDFLKTKIFGNAFLASEYEKEAIPKKIWDVTKITLRGDNLDTIFAWINRLTPYKS